MSSNNLKLTEKVNVEKCKIRFVLNNEKVLYLDFIGDKNPTQGYYKYFWFGKICRVLSVYYISATQQAKNFLLNLKEDGIIVIENEMIKVKNITEAKIYEIEENWTNVIHENYTFSD